MRMRFSSRFVLVQAALAAVLLSACAGTGPAPVPRTSERAGAESAFTSGQYVQAATVWQQAAVDAQPREAARLRVRAADAWLLAGETARAEHLISRIDRRDLDGEDRARLDLVLADLALRNGRPDEAEIRLRNAEYNLPWSSKSRYQALRDRLQLQDAGPAARDLGAATRLVEGMDYYDPAVVVQFLQAIETASSSELAIRAANPRGDRTLAGWLDLALTIRQNLVRPEGLSLAIQGWKGRHPHHQLTESQALDAWLRYRQQFRPPRRIGVLLPGSGRLQAAGEAIRDGILSAFLDQPAGSEVMFFATGDDEQSAISAYFNALDAGVDWIIGPLRKESVAAMLGLAGMSTPVLALNDLPGRLDEPEGLAGQIRGISLSQEQEVGEIAAHVLRSGFRKAMVIAPESSWGERMAYAFEAGFLQEDTEIVVAARYPEAENDHSAMLERMLHIDQSKARKQRLENTLQMSLEFEPVRRDDVDLIFMAASPEQARLIRPQLRFHDAGDIPVYATGRVFSGQPDPARNQDLDGVRFPATPWHLDHTERDSIPGLASLRGGTLGVLYALGQDAWNILPWLELMQRDPDFAFPGRSGDYRDSADGNLRREPAWAVFSAGRPVSLQAPVALDGG